MEAIPGHLFSCLKTIRIKILSWAVQRPILALALVILISGLLLPLVSAVALMPVVVVLHIGDYLESKGLLVIIYAVFCQGLILAIILVILFFFAFVIATSVSILHSYNFFQLVHQEKKTF